MAYGIKTARQNKKPDSANPLQPQSRSKSETQKNPMAVFGTRIQPAPVADEPVDDSKMQQTLAENRKVAEQLAAKMNVRRASSRQLLSSSRSETLGIGG